MRFYFVPLLAVIFFACASNVNAVDSGVSVYPGKNIQGEPILVSVEGVASVKSISFDGKKAGVFNFKNKPSAFFGIDLNRKPGDYRVVVTLLDGSKLEKIVTVGKREKVEAPLGIPEKLGGNTPKAAGVLVSTLSQENQKIYSVKSISKQLWSADFKFPVVTPVVTDPYGYSRQTVGYSITHKGTDFRAGEGTPVTSMNRGIVRFAKILTVYGKTVIVDHGFGLHTVYMHLSKIKVNEGELVKLGQSIGFSGSTGYAESPHLHVSVWIDKVSVDPMKFMALFN